MLELKIKKLTKTAIIPTQGSAQAAGLDLYADIPVGNINYKSENVLIVEPHSTVFIGTGLSMAIPEKYFGGIYARSGLACKESLRPANCVGVIDSDYRGEVKVAIHNDSDKQKIISHGQRIAQLIIQPYLNVNLVLSDELNDTERGESGFGSSGK